MLPLLLIPSSKTEMISWFAVSGIEVLIVSLMSPSWMLSLMVATTIVSLLGRPFLSGRGRRRQSTRLNALHNTDTSPLCCSADGLFAAEATAGLQRLSHLLAHKWSKPYSVVHSFISARLSLVLVYAATMCLIGSRVSARKVSKRWDDRGALDLFR
ncbi:expressed unknown protein [Seminavis robusta]|uniref:Uncharacterized protein n=1 Tax=Seminavis robusta TaxID=568900 RepID=A0A9N8EXS6_9STRA|nr:expressed unknown protein [Seminavis robusta]|eukprot:Sro2104_g314721.1  (156) ;mRNA; r:10525-10992